MPKKRTPLDEFAKLLENPSHNLSVDVYNEKKKIIKEPGVKKPKSKYTLNQIGDMVLSLNTRIDNLENKVDDGFKQVNTRIDYIVQANNLKDNK